MVCKEDCCTQKDKPYCRKAEAFHRRCYRSYHQEDEVDKVENAIMEDKERRYHILCLGSRLRLDTVHLEIICIKLLQSQYADEIEETYNYALEPINPKESDEAPVLQDCNYQSDYICCNKREGGRIKPEIIYRFCIAFEQVFHATKGI